MSLYNRIGNYLQDWNNIDPEKWIHKGEIESLAKQAGYLGETSGRELRLLHEKGVVEKRKKNKSLEYRFRNI